MADVEATVPGTWFVTVTFGDGSIRNTVMTFTSDGGLVDRAEPRVEAGVGVWEAGDEDNGDNGDNEFRFMFFRFLENLTVTPTPGNPGRVTQDFARISRVRATNRLIDHDTFTGTGTVDALDAAGNLVATPPAFHTTHDAVRMKLVRE